MIKRTIKSSNSWYIVIIIILISLNGVHYFNFSKINKSKTILTQRINEYSVRDQNKNKHIEEKLLFDKLNSNSLNTKFCDSILNGNKKVFAIINRNICTKCLVHFIMDLNLLKDRVGKENVIILGNFENTEHYRKMLKNVPPEIKTYEYKEVFIDRAFDSIFEHQPQIFVLEPNYQTKFFYSPEELPELRKKYFNSILPNYFNEN